MAEHIQEAINRAVDPIWDNCKVVLYFNQLVYPIEHNKIANKDCREMIEEYIYQDKYIGQYVDGNFIADAR